MEKIRAVEIEGTIKRLRTMADGSIDLTINLQESCTPQAGKMLEWINNYIGGVLEVIERDDDVGAEKSRKIHI